MGSLVAACRLLSCGMWTLSCSMWDLVPQPGIEPGPPALGAQSLTLWTTREVPWLHFKFMISKLIWKSVLIHSPLTLLDLFSKHLPYFFGLESSLAFLLISFPDDGLISYFTRKIKAFRHYFQIYPSFPSFLFGGRNIHTFYWGSFHLLDFFTSILPLDVSCMWNFVLSGLITFYLFSEKAFINNHGFKGSSMFTFLSWWCNT